MRNTIKLLIKGCSGTEETDFIIPTSLLTGPLFKPHYETNPLNHSNFALHIWPIEWMLEGPEKFPD